VFLFVGERDTLLYKVQSFIQKGEGLDFEAEPPRTKA